MNILITGASKGIGYELTKQFAKDTTNKIVVMARSQELLSQLKEECKKYYLNNIHIYSVDFLSDDFTLQLKKIFTEQSCHFDIVINNAGILINQPFLTTNKKQIEITFKVNYIAPVEIIKLAIANANREKSCHIINIGSMGGFQGSVKFPGLSMYSASKSALANLTESLAEEYKDTNIKFNCLALGSVQTEMLSKAFPNYEAQLSPKQLALFVVDFSVNGHQYFNGKIIPVSKNTP